MWYLLLHGKSTLTTKGGEEGRRSESKKVTLQNVTAKKQTSIQVLRDIVEETSQKNKTNTSPPKK